LGDRKGVQPIPCCDNPKINRVATHLENLEKSGNLISVREKSGKLGKVREIVIFLFCATAVAMVNS